MRRRMAVWADGWVCFCLPCRSQPGRVRRSHCSQADQRGHCAPSSAAGTAPACTTHNAIQHSTAQRSTAQVSASSPVLRCCCQRLFSGALCAVGICCAPAIIATMRFPLILCKHVYRPNFIGNLGLFWIDFYIGLIGNAAGR